MFYLFSMASIIIGLLLDLIIGDPEGWPHVVRLIGSFIEYLDEKIRVVIGTTPRERKLGGVLCWVLVMFVTIGISGGILFVCWKISPHLYLIIASIVCFEVLSVKALKQGSLAVMEKIDAGNLPAARNFLSMIVGRDTYELDEKHVIMAAVETVAENTCDGCVAPLFYLMLFGPVGGLAYKAVNTMDSMLGYKDEKYIDFGFFAAKADDVANFIPARLSAVLMIVSAFFLKLDWQGAVEIFKRDRFKSESVNAGQTESVCAGALGIQLLGDATYKGVLHKRPLIGYGIRECNSDDIDKTNDMMYLTVILTVILVIIWRVVCAKLFHLI